MTGSPLSRNTTSAVCGCVDRCGDVPERDDRERAVCKGLRGSGFEHDGLIAERDRLREAAKTFIEAIERTGSSVPAKEFFDLAEALDV